MLLPPLTSTMHLARILVDIFHGLKIHALARHGRRMFVLVQDLIESRGVALRDRQHLQAIGLRIEEILGGLAARTRHDIVAIGFRILLIALPVLIRLDGVALRILDGLGNDDVVQLHADDVDAQVVVIERLLQQLLGAVGDRRIERQRLVDRGLPDRLAHGALAYLHQRLFDIVDLEQILARFRLGVLHRRFDLDQIGIGGQHSRIVRECSIAARR